MTSDVTGATGHPKSDRALTTMIKEASMSSTPHGGDGASDSPGPATVALKLEVAVLPVADADRAKAFYEGLGWRLDANVTIDQHYRVVQFTPPGSTASIIFGQGTTNMAPGSLQDLVLVVEDLDAARDELIRRGADVSEIWHDETGIFHHGGTEARVPGRDPKGRSYGSWASFSDPDGNGWLLQEITQRLPGRE
jgi:catechol 2,3-dioxygenase-like lactoylglutathione lyase family enzyme